MSLSKEVASYECGCLFFSSGEGQAGMKLVRCALHDELNRAIMTRERIRSKTVAAALPINSATYFSRVLEENRQLHQIMALKREDLREEIRQTRDRVTFLMKALRAPPAAELVLSNNVPA
jgi:hypothetical protein